MGSPHLRHLARRASHRHDRDVVPRADGGATGRAEGARLDDRQPPGRPVHHDIQERSDEKPDDGSYGGDRSSGSGGSCDLEGDTYQFCL